MITQILVKFLIQIAKELDLEATLKELDQEGRAKRKGKFQYKYWQGKFDLRMKTGMDQPRLNLKPSPYRIYPRDKRSIP